MGLLKPVFFRGATSAADVQKLMKADLKNSAGKTGLKFIAAKNVVIGGRAINLFILTDTPAPFETILKDLHPKAYRAKGTCDVVKDKISGDTQVTIKTSVGQILPDAVVKLMPLVTGNDTTIVAKFTELVETPKTPTTLKRTPTPKVKGGVAEWAQGEYRGAAERTLIASMTPDGKIGSVYFGEEGRIRTTHSQGPEKEPLTGAEATVLQFNVDMNAAWQDFAKRHPKKSRAKDVSEHWEEWLKKQLKDGDVQRPPVWAKRIVFPQQAHDLRRGAPPANLKLIEIFKDINGEIESWHPSRGTAVKFETDKQTVAVLNAAIKFIDKKKLTDPRARNVAFYNFIKSRLPKLVALLRAPNTI